MTNYDIVIAGGAMAGMTLALALNDASKGKLKVAVVEPCELDHSKHPGFDSRCIALSHGTVQILRKYGLWEVLQPLATQIDDIHVSDRHHAGMTDISSKDLFVDALGYVVELAHVGREFQKLVDAIENIDYLCPDSVESIERSTKQVSVCLSSGSQIQANLLVAADGAGSTCCELLNMPSAEHDFEQSAVIANVVTSEQHNHRAFERFTENGPVALLPLSENRMSLVWCMAPKHVNEVIGLSDDEFLSRLQSEFGWRLGQFTQVGKRANYPLVLRTRMQNVSHRFAIVGNAAQTLHPIAGQGFNLGIRDVASLVEEIEKCIEDPGQHKVLAGFRTRRESDRINTIQLTSCLVHLFSNELPALRLARNLGLFAMDNLPQLKAPLLQQTLGLIDR